MDARTEERLNNLEILLTQQDDVVETLSRLAHEQRLQIEKMQQQLTLLQDKLSNTDEAGVISEQDETPPHY